jgi:hypothetical protein
VTCIARWREWCQALWGPAFCGWQHSWEEYCGFGVCVCVRACVRVFSCVVIEFHSLLYFINPCISQKCLSNVAIFKGGTLVLGMWTIQMRNQASGRFYYTNATWTQKWLVLFRCFTWAGNSSVLFHCLDCGILLTNAPLAPAELRNDI